MRRLDDEHGAVAVFVAIILVIVFAIAALVIEIGQLYWERRQLQNGADAAALALATECAQSLPGCVGGLLGGVAEPYADANAYDDASAVPSVMPHGANAQDCEPGGSLQPNPLLGANAVKVTTRTVDANNGNAPHIRHLFAPLVADLLGDTPNGETAVRACAVATWGNIGGGATIPIALCEGSWEHWTSSGTNLPSGPPAHTLRFGTPPGVANPGADCTNPSGDTYPGGFGFLTRDADCVATTNEADMADGSTGDNPNDPGSLCTVAQMYTMLTGIVDSGEPALIPIFDYHTGTGTNAQFHIIGYGAFVLEGYSVNGGPGGSDKTYGMSISECTGGASCLKGYFTEFVALDALPSGGGGGSYGATGVFLTD